MSEKQLLYVPEPLKHPREIGTIYGRPVWIDDWLFTRKGVFVGYRFRRPIRKGRVMKPYPQVAR